MSRKGALNSLKTSRIVSISDKNFASAILLNKIRLTKKGGFGVNTVGYPGKDYVVDLVVTGPGDNSLLLFTNVGKVYKANININKRTILTSEDATWPSKPTNISTQCKTKNFSFAKGEKIVQALPIKESDYSKNLFLLFATNKGMLKKVSVSEFKYITKAGKSVIKLLKGDSLRFAIKIKPKDEVLLATSNGYVVRFKSEKIRKLSRKSVGVKGMKLSDANLISLSSTSKPKDALVLSVDEEGKGKCTGLKSFRLTSRRSGGILAYKLSKKSSITKGNKKTKVAPKEKGSLAACFIVHDNEEIVLLTNKNHMNRFRVSHVVKRTGRITSGTTLIKMTTIGEKVACLAKYDPEEVTV